MGKALYRSKRPKTLDDVIGQEHIVSTLKQALKQGKLSHAYLFTGPRGVGKTSVARILAHAVNGLEYTDESMDLDIIEIDAASNRRIDEVRELRERVRIAPVSSKYKVIIIDEVHMLTREAFNALLKTLEEPPEYVIFILATTEVHKLPETIISRTQRFNFRPIEPEKAVEYLRQVAKNEKITIDDAALELIAGHGNGSLRDSLGLLDQLGSSGSVVDANRVLNIIGAVPDGLITELLDATLSANAVEVVNNLTALHRQGFEASRITKQLGDKLRSAYLASQNNSLPKDVILSVMSALIDIPASLDPQTALEICLLEAASHSQAPAKALDTEVVAVKPNTPTKPPTPTAKESKPVATKLPTPSITQPAPADDESLWPQVLEAIKQEYNTLYGIARMAHANLNGDTLKLTVHFPFHQKRLNDSGNRRIIGDTANELAGRNIEIICEVDESLPKPETTSSSSVADIPASSNDPSITSISNIFGGAELIQSE
jgi:DNA polymerase-3 subunit gamma/tau